MISTPPTSPSSPPPLCPTALLVFLPCRIYSPWTPPVTPTRTDLHFMLTPGRARCVFVQLQEILTTNCTPLPRTRLPPLRSELPFPPPPPPCPQQHHQKPRVLPPAPPSTPMTFIPQSRRPPCSIVTPPPDPDSTYRTSVPQSS